MKNIARAPVIQIAGRPLRVRSCWNPIPAAVIASPPTSEPQVANIRQVFAAGGVASKTFTGLAPFI
jgi:hypothetical protein